MKLASICAAFLLAGSALAGSVEAAPLAWTVTTHGVIDEGRDDVGIFGEAGRLLDGLEFIQAITASVDPSRYSLVDVQPNAILLSGAGLSFTVRVTVDGATALFHVTDATTLQTIRNGATALSDTEPADVIGTVGAGQDGDYEVGAGNLVASEDPAYALVPLLDFNQAISREIDDPSLAQALFLLVWGNDATGFSGAVDSITVTAGPDTDVPEPASIGLLAAGLLGIRLQRRAGRR